MEVLKEKMEHYIKRMEYTYGDKEYKNHLDTLLDEFNNDTFIATDKFELSYLQEKVERMKFIIEVNFNLKWDEKTALIGRIDMFKKNIKYSGWRIADIQTEIMKII